MRHAIALVAAFVTIGVFAAGAAGNGSPYSPGLVQGWNGVPDAGGKVRFVTMATGRYTIVAAVRTRDGRVLRTNTIRGYYGVPIVTYDGTTGGVSGDGRTVVLGGYGPFPGVTGSTPFAVLDARTLKLRRKLELRGSWAYDAISPDGSTIFLIEYVSAPPSPRYKVRAFDAVKGRLVPGAIVDRREDEVLMRGQPVTRVPSSDGRWAYTLYARTKNEPFVHALDTLRRQAYCVDLPLELGQQKQMELRLAAAANGELKVRSGLSVLAVVDTETFEVRTR
jgi:hypothetical protein